MQYWVEEDRSGNLIVENKPIEEKSLEDDASNGNRSLMGVILGMGKTSGEEHLRRGPWVENLV